MIDCFELIGLFLNFIGALIIAMPLLKSKEEILAISRYNTYGAVLDLGKKEEINENLKKSLILNNKFAGIGITIFTLGFLIQIIGLFN